MGLGVQLALTDGELSQPTLDRPAANARVHRSYEERRLTGFA